MVNEGGGGVEVETLRAVYLIEHHSEIPGKGRRLIALLGRVLERTRLPTGEPDPNARALFVLGGEITHEIRQRAGEWIIRR